jgi:hypothetical protein
VWTVFKGDAVVLKYQLVQRDSQRFELKLVTVDDQAYRRAAGPITARLRDLLGHDATIDCERFDDLGPAPGGKFRSGGRRAVPPARPCATPGRNSRIMTPDGFCPLLFTDQLIRNYRYRGSRMTFEWAPDEVAAVSSSLRAIASWLRDLGYIGAPAGVDGLLIRRDERLQFIGLDPNSRMTGTMMPWAVAATLSEAAGRRFVWQYESFVVAGRAITLRWLQQRLETSLVSAARLEQGGILPSLIVRPGFPLGVSWLQALVLGQDADHLAHLRDQTRRLGVLMRRPKP